MEQRFPLHPRQVVGMLSASPGSLGGLRSQSHLAPLLLNLHCWVSPKNFACHALVMR